MPEDTTSADAQAANADPAQAATSSNAQAATDTEPVSLEDARKLRSEAANLRKREKEALAQLKVYQDKEQQAKDAQVPELDRWQKQATDLQSKYDADTSALTERIVGYEVKLQASKLGIIDPDAASQLLNWDALEYDDDGMPTNVEDLLKDLLKRKSYLGPKGASSAGGATNPSRAASNGSQITEQYVEQLLSGQLPQGTYEKLSMSQREEVQRILDKRRKF